MNQAILKEILQQCNWHEKLKIKACKKISIRAYELGVKAGFNWQNTNRKKISH